MAVNIFWAGPPACNLLKKRAARAWRLEAWKLPGGPTLKKIGPGARGARTIPNRLELV